MILVSDILFDYTFALNLDSQVWSWVSGPKSEKINYRMKKKKHNYVNKSTGEMTLSH